jgi:WD40 repeat protein
MRTKRLRAFAATVSLCAACTAAPDESGSEPVGIAMVSLAEPPADVLCLRITVTGTKSADRRFTLTEGQNSTFYLQRLPLGMDTFTGFAYSIACSAVSNASGPSWVSSPTPVTISATMTASVRLVLHRNTGGANVAVDFGDDSTIPRVKDLLLGNQDAHTVGRYDGSTGTFIGNFAFDLGEPLGMAFGADRDLYVSGGSINCVNRYDGTTGDLVASFASGDPLVGPTALVFGPDGNLYVCTNNNGVLRYDGASGAYMGVFVASGSGGLSYTTSLTFGPDGNLYVGSWNTASILRYSGTTGAFMDAFVPSGEGGISTPSGISFGPDGNLYVAGGPDGVRRYNGSTGAFMGIFASYSTNTGRGGFNLVFGPDGQLYVTMVGVEPGVDRFDGSNGALIDHFVIAGSSDALFNPWGLIFFP